MDEWVNVKHHEESLPRSTHRHRTGTNLRFRVLKMPAGNRTHFPLRAVDIPRVYDVLMNYWQFVVGLNNKQHDGVQYEFIKVITGTVIYYPDGGIGGV